MQKSKILSLVLAAALAAGALAGCGGGNASSSSAAPASSSAPASSAASSAPASSAADSGDAAPIDLSEKLSYTAMAASGRSMPTLMTWTSSRLSTRLPTSKSSGNSCPMPR